MTTSRKTLLIALAALVAGAAYVVLNGRRQDGGASSAASESVPASEGAAAGGPAPPAADEPNAGGGERPRMGFASLPAEHQPEAMRKLGAKLASWLGSNAGGVDARVSEVDCASAPCVINAVLAGEGDNDVRDRAVAYLTEQASFATPRNVVTFDDPRTGKQHVWLFWPPVAPDKPNYVEYLIDASIRAKAARDELEAAAKGGGEAGRAGSKE